jgi:hypothetical protein
MVLASGSGVLLAQDLEIFFNGGITGGKKTTITDYHWDWGTDYIDVLERGSMQPSISSQQLYFSAGIAYYFSSDLGLSLSVAHTKRNLDLSSDYSISWTWFDGESHTRNRNWTDSANVSITPVMLDMIYQGILSRHFNINIRAGLGFFFTKFNLDSHMGYAETLETEDYYYIDWYDLKVKADRKDILLAGNVGIDLERKINHRFGIYAGIQYFHTEPLGVRVEAEPQDVHYGEEGQLYTTATPDIHVTGPISLRLKFSFFRTFIGMKVYL